jgi:hypothetical protein
MPCISAPTALCNSALTADPFFAAAVRSVRRTEVRVRREERLTGIPHRFSHSKRRGPLSGQGTLYFFDCGVEQAEILGAWQELQERR